MKFIDQYTIIQSLSSCVYAYIYICINKEKMCGKGEANNALKKRRQRVAFWVLGE